MILRLPEEYAPVHSPALNAPSVASAASEFGASALYARHEGGLLSRALGTAVHSLLEELARLCASIDMHAARATLTQFEPRIAAQIRSTGVAASQAARIAADALEVALAASRDATGEWILTPHPGAASEVEWAGVLRGSLSNVRVDRVFRAGLTPLSEDDSAWWIVDYKTAQADAAGLPQLRALFGPQLDAYAHVLRNLHGADAVICAGLYYPRMLLFDWFEL
jgi:hypothetical protein